MKKYNYLIGIMTVSLMILTSCGSVDTSRDTYFGYNNTPKIEAKEDDSQSNIKRWNNPLRSDYEAEDNFRINYNLAYMPPSYIPVIMPWWDRYYSWYYYPFSGVYFHHGFLGYSMFDWYSPFHYHSPYVYNPRMYYYGNAWWDWYPYYGNHSKKEKPVKTYTVRDFGPNRGSYGGDLAPFAGGTSSSSGKTRDRGTSSERQVVSGGNQADSPDIIKFKPVSTKDNSSKSEFQKSNTRSSSETRTRVSKDSQQKGSSFGTSNSGINSSSSGSKSSSGSGSSGSSGSKGSSSGSGSSSSSTKSSSRPR